MPSRSGSTALLIGLLLMSVPRIAAAQEPARRPDFSKVTFMPASSPRASFTHVDTKPSDVERARPSVLMASLYASTAIVQGLDVHSTMSAINAGASERNPLMSYLTSHPPAFVAVKASAATGLIFVGRSLAKHNKKHAAIALIAIDSAYVFIAAHNYRVANRLR